MLRGICLLLTVTLGSVVLAAEAQARGYATDDEGRLYSILPETKEYEKLGTVKVTKVQGKKSETSEPSLTDLALSDLHGLYGISYTDLYKIDMRDPTHSKHIGSLTGNLFGQFNALAFDEHGTLYALQGQTLHTVNLKTGRATAVGGAGSQFNSAGDLVVIRGRLYGTFDAVGGCHLVQLDPKTGKGTDIGLIRLRKAKAKSTSKKAGAEEKPKPKPKRELRTATALQDVWGLIWDGAKLWALTPAGHILNLDIKTAVATPHFRAPVTFWGSCAMLRL